MYKSEYDGARHKQTVALTEMFRTSSFCDGGTCVAVAAKDSDEVVVKNTVDGRMVSFTHAEWQAFTQGVKAGEFELL